MRCVNHTLHFTLFLYLAEIYLITKKNGRNGDRKQLSIVWNLLMSNRRFWMRCSVTFPITALHSMNLANSRLTPNHSPAGAWNICVGSILNSRHFQSTRPFILRENKVLQPFVICEDVRQGWSGILRAPNRALDQRAAFLVRKPFQLQNGTHSEGVLMISESRA